MGRVFVKNDIRFTNKFIRLGMKNYRTKTSHSTPLNLARFQTSSLLYETAHNHVRTIRLGNCRVRTDFYSVVLDTTNSTSPLFLQTFFTLLYKQRLTIYLHRRVYVCCFQILLCNVLPLR